MPLALAIETSGRVGSLALIEDRQIIGEDSFPHGLRHAADMIPRIDSLLRQRKFQPRQIETLFVSVGPGSFTGLRIGITLAKTFALATGAKLVAVPSLAVLAENAPAEARHLLVVLDARRGKIFSARFEKVQNLWIERDPGDLGEIGEALRRAPRPLFLLGDGISFHRAAIPPTEPDLFITPESLWTPHVAAVAQIGLKLADAGRFTPPDQLLPIYMRPPEAAEKWALRENG
jgi:tRNA threonylcarbamoyladenosine biosynthesis protein TsaB